jgi:DeoR family fructose operon transcriptional repressor
MTFQKRRLKILQLLDQTGDADVHVLSGELGISEITVRRDLNRMAEDGMIFRTHGVP